MTELGVILITFMGSSALMYSSGAYGALERVRSLEKVKNFGIFDCYLCLSFWVALFATIAVSGSWQLFAIAWGFSYLADKLLTLLTFKMVQ